MRLRSRRVGWGGSPRGPSKPREQVPGGGAAPSLRAGDEIPPDEWRVLATIRPGDPGTKRILRDWGARLVCVRYRYNPRLKRRVTTAELVMHEGPWRHKHFEEVGVTIRSWENDLRLAIVKAGGIWDRELGMWVLQKRSAARLGLEDRAKPVRRESPITPPDPGEVTISRDRKITTNGNPPPHISNPRNRP